MNRIRPFIAIVPGTLIVAIFLANGIGITDQSVPVREMSTRGNARGSGIPACPR
jgi:hypothetical protein